MERRVDCAAMGWRGQLLHFVMVMSDVSHRRQLEEHLRQSQKMEAVGRLAGGLAHDFNNLLTVIMGSAQRATQMLRSQSTDLEQLMDDIGAAADRGAALTRQLLTFSRKQVLDLRHLRVNDLVSRLGRILQRMLGEDISLEYRLGEGTGQVFGDRSQLEQVLLNLAVNARDAMPNGGKCTVETRTVDLDDDYVAHHPDARFGPHVCIAVADNGTGIISKIAEHIFEPFFTTKQPGEGTGMGLATVFGIVRQSQGHITWSTEVGRGTTFCIYLPLASEEASVPATDPYEIDCPSGSETVLLVEDEENVLRVAASCLQEQGYNVLTASSGEAACELAASSPDAIDLLVVDVVMPGMNGVKVAKQVAKTCPGIKTLYVSGYTDSAVLSHIVGEDALFLNKPYQQRSLACKVREALDGGLA